MGRRGNHNGPSTSPNSSSRVNDNMIGILQGIVESHQQQLKICLRVRAMACDVERGLEKKDER